MLSLVTVSPVITAFYSCCISHHVFDQVNLWPAWVGFETAIQLKENYKFGTDPDKEDQIRRTNNWIYKTKRSMLDRPSGPMAQQIEALRLYGSR